MKSEKRPFLRPTALRLVIIMTWGWMLTFPFPHQLLPDLGTLLSTLSESLINFTAQQLFSLEEGTYIASLSSDTTGLYLHVFNLFILGVLGSLFWWKFTPPQDEVKLFRTWHTSLRYYLALCLFFYGFNKVFNYQFYTPEPNTLFTTVGETPRDLLYWTAMGTSDLYSRFAGLMEIVPATLLLFRKTTLLGAFIAVGVLLNVMMINFGFNISVKVFSSVLTFMALLVLIPYRHRLLAIFGQSELKQSPNFLRPVIATKRWYRLAKTIIIVVLLLDATWVYLERGNFNDDLAPRPVLHGAYAVEIFTENNLEVPPLSTTIDRWQRFFVHRQGYFIVQDMRGHMQDYQLSLAGEDGLVLTHPLTGENSVLRYQKSEDGSLTLQGSLNGKAIAVQTQKLDLDQLPLLQREFHWSIDAFLQK